MVESRLQLQPSIGEMINRQNILHILGISFFYILTTFLATERYTDATWHNRHDHSTGADCEQLSPVIVKHAQF